MHIRAYEIHLVGSERGSRLFVFVTDERQISILNGADVPPQEPALEPVSALARLSKHRAHSAHIERGEVWVRLGE